MLLQRPLENYSPLRACRFFQLLLAYKQLMRHFVCNSCRMLYCVAYLASVQPLGPSGASQSDMAHARYWVCRSCLVRQRLLQATLADNDLHVAHFKHCSWLCSLAMMNIQDAVHAACNQAPTSQQAFCSAFDTLWAGCCIKVSLHDFLNA